MPQPGSFFCSEIPKNCTDRSDPFAWSRHKFNIAQNNILVREGIHFANVLRVTLGPMGDLRGQLIG